MTDRAITLTESEFNDRLAKMVKAAVESLKSEFANKFANYDKQIAALTASMPSNEALKQTINDAVEVAVDTEAKSLRADVLALADSIGATKKNSAFGLGSTTAKPGLSKADFAAVLPAKIMATPLSEVAKFVEAS